MNLFLCRLVVPPRLYHLRQKSLNKVESQYSLGWYTLVVAATSIYFFLGKTTETKSVEVSIELPISSSKKVNVLRPRKQRIKLRPYLPLQRKKSNKNKKQKRLLNKNKKQKKLLNKNKKQKKLLNKNKK